MNYHQTPEEIIKNASAEQRILWNYIFLRFGEKIGLVQFNYKGVIAASEFLTYSANKLYLGLQVDFGTINAGAGITAPYISFYDNINAVDYWSSNVVSVWDATAAAIKYNSSLLNMTNILFSRIVVSNYTHIHFLGYRLSI